MAKETKTITVTIDKNHLLNLGERMYVESIELIRELVNNAYDADATEVAVRISNKNIVIEDNGSGMNRDGLTQFFTIGSEEKKKHSLSPRFNRKRIGQFGIGKFAALSAADRFIVESRKKKKVFSVIFDKKEWQKNDTWQLPITEKKVDLSSPRGTRVTLSELKRDFNLDDVEKYLKESVPLRAKKFAVLLNGRRITAKFIPGRHIPVSIKTIYGLIEGEIVVALRPQLVDKPGIHCCVKQVLIMREFFGLERRHSFGLTRITGSINADFLPVLSGRNDFVRDSAEFKLFYKLISFELEKVLAELKKETDLKNIKRIKKELKLALNKIRTALKLHPELTPSGQTITNRRKKSEAILASTSKISAKSKNKKRKIRRESKKRNTLPKPEVLRRIRLQKLGLSVALVAMGKDGPEVMAEDNVIYLNRDHPLYQKLYHRHDQLELHLLRLITQEIVLMKRLRLNAKDAFDWQSKLLTDAVCKD